MVYIIGEQKVELDPNGVQAYLLKEAFFSAAVYGEFWGLTHEVRHTTAQLLGELRWAHWLVSTCLLPR